MAKRKSNPISIKKKKNEEAREFIDPKPEPMGVTGEERHHLISKAAYFLAERRGFISGAELEDWLEAEAEIDGKLRKTPSEDPFRGV
jgi:hypothetical protein